MQLGTLFSLSLAAFSFAPTTLACHYSSDSSKTQDCCWGGKSNIDQKYGYAGCFNQHKGNNVCDKQRYKDNYCSQHGVTEKDCVSDVVFEMEG
ncbi:hypothetical protein Vi05172_g2837 [Venturia inaequalis]|nr:hypothetical protein Vi05172_g2837 [Venturia inaequalis]